MKKEYSAGVIIYYTDLIDDHPLRLYLLLHYPKGYWDLAKGKLEQDETSQNAALREAKEETGLTVELIEGFEEDLGYFFTGREGHIIDKTVTYYVGRAPSQEVTLSHEHIDYAWLPYKEALKKLAYKNAQKMLTQAEQFLHSLEN